MAVNKKQFIVGIDPGHQRTGNPTHEQIGPGANRTKAKVADGTIGRYSGLSEYELNLKVGLLLRDELETRGYLVVMTRTANDVDISNVERVRIAEASHADIFVHIHANHSDDPAESGAMTACMTPDNPYCAQLYTESHRLSETILDALTATTGARTLGIRETDVMSGINWASMPVTIIEMGFMSNEEEDRLMATAEYMEKLARGIACGIEMFFDRCPEP